MVLLNQAPMRHKAMNDLAARHNETQKIGIDHISCLTAESYTLLKPLFEKYASHLQDDFINGLKHLKFN